MSTIEPDRVALHARDVHFDWSGLPLRWIPGQPFASHLLNVLHILLPEGERFFVKTFREALPLIRDDRLREDAIGFIGQEGMHAGAHQGVQDYFTTQGLDASGYVRELERIFRVMLGERGLSGRRQQEWLVERLAAIAGIEHLTAVLGDWVLNSPGLDAAGADPRMLDLLRWHGAEEVEHRAVAFELYMHLMGTDQRAFDRYWSDRWTLVTEPLAGEHCRALELLSIPTSRSCPGRLVRSPIALMGCRASSTDH